MAVEKPKKRPTLLEPRVKYLEENLENLTNVVRKIAHFSGNQRILIEYGIDPWVPGKSDMKKYKD